MAAHAAGATSIPVNFVKAEFPPGPTDTTLPYYMNNANDALFLKFKIPHVKKVASINSFVINIDVYDDGDGGNEVGVIFFALPGPNLPLDAFGPNLNGFTSLAPKTISITLFPFEIDEILPTLDDGHFRIRIDRLAGDYYVAGGNVQIDANLVPEPASAGMLMGGLLATAAIVRLRSRR